MALSLALALPITETGNRSYLTNRKQIGVLSVGIDNVIWIGHNGVLTNRKQITARSIKMCNYNTVQYEQGGQFTVGGPTGLYRFTTPYNTECEWCIVTVSSNGAGTATIAGGDQTAITLSSTQSFGLGTATDSNNTFPGHVCVFPSTGGLEAPTPLWVPFGRGGSLTVNISITSGQVIYVVLAVRRENQSIIPQLPRQQKPASQIDSMHRRSTRFNQEIDSSKTSLPSARRVYSGEELNQLFEVYRGQIEEDIRNGRRS